MSETNKNSLESPKYWEAQYRASKKKLHGIVEVANKVYDRYEQDKDTTETLKSAGYAASSNILWANSQVEKPAYYSRVPKVVTATKYEQKSPKALKAADILEKATAFQLEDEDNFNDALNDSVQDFMLAGRGQIRVKYVPQFGVQDIEVPVIPQVDLTTGQTLMLDTEGQPVDVAQVSQDSDGSYFIARQIEDVLTAKVDYDFVPFKDFNHSPCSSWKKVTWVSFDNYLSKDEVIEQFGKGVAEKLKYDTSEKTDPNVRSGYESTNEKYDDKALIVEIWDKKSRKVRYVSPSSPDVFLRVDDDPLGLRNFFPCPKPLCANRTTRSLIGRPSYIYYKHHVDALDAVCEKRYMLIEKLRVAGFYDKTAGEDLIKVLTGNHNDYAPVDWVRFAEKGGIKGVVETLDLTDIVNQIQVCHTSEQQILARIYEISGTSDIMRGLSDPNSTATAEQMKGQFATLRIAEKQKAIQDFARELVCITAEIIAEKFPESLLELLSGEEGKEEQDPVFAQAVAILREDGLRRVKVDIETDSTVAIDETMQRQQLSEYTTAVSGFLQVAIPLIQQLPAFTGFVMELLKKTSHAFRMGRSMDAVLEKAIEQMQQEQEMAKRQPPPPDPAMIKIQQEGQIAQAKLTSDQQLAMAKLQQDRELQLAAMEAGDQKSAAEIAVAAQKIRQDYDIELSKLSSKDIENTVRAINQRSIRRQEK